ncbi:restriction endonuclease subunit S [Microbacterium hibisci]|uniref:restriction endonuclease subunit S n=1 Tax=Microbacterium hibisci TaxID=2036000 RepID=UPI00194572EC|nr:restriction endonuclease subunit S [Microbacterium hibisci]
MTVKLRGAGAIQRSIGEGKTPRPFRGSRVRGGDLIYSRIDARNGAFAIIPADLDGAVVSKDFPTFGLDLSRVDAAYLTHLVRAPSFWARFQAMSFGATNRQRIDERLLLAQRVPLPSVPEQRRISAILGEADKLRSATRVAARATNDLAHACFLEMIGTRTIARERWPHAPIGALGTVITGNTPPRSNRENYGGPLEWVKSDNLRSDGLYVKTATESLSAQGARRARLAPPGAVLVTCIAGSLQSIGTASLLDREVAFNQQINAFVPRELEPRFALAIFRADPDRVREASNGGMQGLVSKSRFEAVQVPVPPREVRDEFVTAVSLVDSAAAHRSASQRRSDALFASLQHRAFRGEL